MRVLLIQPSNNMEEFLGGGKVFVHSTEPLGLLYIAAVLEEAGIGVEVLDAFVSNMTLEDIKEYIAKGHWEVIGISCLTSNGAFIYYLAKWIKSEFPEIFVALGNIHASVYADFFLGQRCADAVVHGEGEYTVLELIEALRDGKKLDDIRAISWWDGSKVQHNKPREVSDDLDSLPLPARHLVPMEKYTRRDFVAKVRHGNYRVMFSSRGCIYKCIFCVVHKNRRYRIRSPEQVVREMELLGKRYKAGFIEFLDPLFTVNKNRVKEICRLIREKNLDIPWQCEGHINTVDKEVLEAMRMAGCVQIAYGIESGVQMLLDRVRKNIKLENVREVVKLTNKVGIKPLGLFMLGLPGETKEMSLQTIQFARSLPLAFAQFAVTTPYPGSQLYYDLVKQGKLDTEKDPEEKVKNWIRYCAYIAFTERSPIFVPEGREGDELKKLQKTAIRKFYLRPRNILNELKKFHFKNWRDYYTGIKTVFLEG